MVDAVRGLLDELMGKERNVPLNQRSGKSLKYDDPLVCKYAVAGLCPNRLFKNTRSDLGTCGFEMHEDHIQWESVAEDYGKQDDREKERYERRLHKYLEDLIREMDRKISKSKERAAAESAPREIRTEDQGRLNDLQQKARDALEKSQKAGEDGDVDASIMLAATADDLKLQHDRMVKQLTAPDRTMSVCDICGVFVNSTDNDQRRQEHLTGKQFLGWKQIREVFAELTTKLNAVQPPRSRDARGSSREREEPRRERERSPPGGRGQSPRRERDYGHHDRDYDRRGSDPRGGGGRDYDPRASRDPYGGGSGGGGRERDGRGDRGDGRRPEAGQPEDSYRRGSGGGGGGGDSYRGRESNYNDRQQSRGSERDRRERY
ncbi:MAG: hypothetical protein WDW38_002866 [Sanguina aurantia]